jgi:hypothetical protein
VPRPTATTRRRADGATSTTRNRTAADHPPPEARYGLRTGFSWWSASPHQRGGELPRNVADQDRNRDGAFAEIHDEVAGLLRGRATSKA